MPQRRAQVVGDRVREGLQLLVAGLELRRPFRELLVQRADVALPALALRDVVVRLQERDRAPMLVPLQRPPARHDDLRPVSLRVTELAFPAPRVEQLRRNLPQRFGEARVQQLVSDMAGRLLRGPPVQLLRASIPVRDDALHVADEDRVLREIEQARLPRADGDVRLQRVAGVSEVVLRAMSNGAEAGDEQGNATRWPSSARCPWT